MEGHQLYRPTPSALWTGQDVRRRWQVHGVPPMATNAVDVAAQLECCVPASATEHRPPFPWDGWVLNGGAAAGARREAGVNPWRMLHLLGGHGLMTLDVLAVGVPDANLPAPRRCADTRRLSIALSLDHAR